jgi:hypothetical protein
MKKMVINHLEKILVTSDAATIMKEVKKKKIIFIFFFKKKIFFYFSWKFNTLLPRWLLWLLKCKKMNVEMEPISLLPLLENYWIRLKI